MYAFHCMFPAFVAASQSKNGTTVEPLVKNYLYDSHQLPHLMLMTATDHLSWWLLIFLPDTVMTAAELPPPPLKVSWQLLATPWHSHDSSWPLSWQLLATPLTLSWQLLATPWHSHDNYWPLSRQLLATPLTLMTTTGHPPPPWHLQQLQTTPPDTTMTDHPSWQPWQLQTTPSDHSFWQLLTPPPSTHTHTHKSYRPFLLTLMTMTDHPWHSWQLATFPDIHDNNWPSLILMTISDHLSWHSWQLQTIPSDTHANYWPLFMTLYSEPWKIAGTVSIISCKLTLAVGDSCLCCCVHCYMADVCWVQLMGVVYWVLLIPFVLEFLLA